MKRAFPIVLGLALLATFATTAARHVADPPGQSSITDMGDGTACVCPAEPSLVMGALDAVAVGSAGAADVFKSAMTSTDAGPTNAVGIAGKNTFSIQCSTPTCYRVGTTAALAGAVTCATDYQLPALTTVRTISGVTSNDGGLFSRTAYDLTETPNLWGKDGIESGGYTYIAALALDAGNPACKLFQVIKNPTP